MMQGDIITVIPVIVICWFSAWMFCTATSYWVWKKREKELLNEIQRLESMMKLGGL